MTRLVTRLSLVWSSALLVLLVALTTACAPESADHPLTSRSGAVSAGANPGNLDILFMIDNSASMSTTQMKLLTQDPSFMTVLENLPNGLPNIHVAVVSSDMGAPGDATSSIECTPTGDNGLFQSTARGACTNTTLTPGATFISNVDGVANYTGSLTDVFGCIAQLGQSGCGFEHQIASVARALGADGAPAPAQNTGFLRDDAELAIVLLTNEDDCSAPPNTTLYSLNGGQQNVANPLGPIANYRCNQFGHLCTDPASGTPTALIPPPLNAPSDAQGTATAPTLNLTNCESNDSGTGLLTPVASLVAGIKALKPDPDNQIVVGTISPPVTPYTVAWLPASDGQNTQPGELWPEIEHSCGPAGGDDVNPLATQLIDDGSYGDPGVRVAQWVQAFGSNGIVTSICDADYSVGFQAIANRIGMHLQGLGTGGSGGGGTGGTSGNTGTGGTGGAGAVGGAGGHGTVGGGGGTSGGGGATASGAAGNGGSGTGGAGTAGTGGNTGTGGASTGAMGGHAGTSGESATGGISGTTGTGGTAAAGTSGSATGGAGGGTTTTGTGTGGAGGAVAGGTGGTAAAGASGAGTGGAAGAGETGGHAGSGTGTGGTTEGAGNGGCSCDTGGSSPSGAGLALLLGALALLTKRRRGAAVIMSSSRRR